MCGIAGLLNCGDDAIRQVKKMTNAMIHRGPDSEGFIFYENDNVALGHRRLAILDLSQNGAQPMVSKNQRYTIVLNGEIYNFEDLKKQLLQNGFSNFRSTSDTEVLLEYFSSFGVEKTLEDINGMYAIGLYDRKDKKLMLARDRGGEKPLYYGWLGKNFVFASELKSIKAIDDNSELRINEDAAKLFLKYGYVPQPLSIYENIYKLMSGTYIEIKFPFVECESPHRYWTFGESDPKWENLEYDEAKEVLKKLLKKSVTRQMVTDVPYGAFLSGGIDSTLITAVMQSISDKPVNTFTIGFEESNFNEAKYAKEIARFLGTNYTEYYFTHKELLEYIPKMSMIYDEPLADISQLAMCLLSDTAKKRVTVCLSGDCGDELFLGYGNYKKLPDIRKKYPSILGKPLGTMVSGLKFIDSRFETKGRKLKNDLKKDIWESFGASVYWNKCMNLSVKNNNLYDIRRELIADKSFVDQLAVWDFYTEMSDMILTKVDRAAMSCSLETRVPFLDKDIIGFVNSIPTEYKIKEKNQKRILKDILEEYVPRRLFERPKQGFAVPMHSFFRNELKEWADSYIYSEKMYQSLEFINKTLLQKQWEIFQKNDKRTGMFEFWRFFILAQWIESVNKM